LRGGAGDFFGSEAAIEMLCGTQGNPLMLIQPVTTASAN